MSQWHYYRRSDCPVCLGQRKDCRQSLSTELVHCRSTDANPPDWNFVGEDSLGFGMWVERRLAEEQDAERRAEYQRQRELERQKRLEEEARQRAEALSVEARSP
ncbi:MAG: hypothetical protein SAJ72_24565, partial [Jaaginema sp. PMC 1080.18]|nr:hypothetical protein [Jaaginema sp. PMC 1080.18]MEC4869179.1 hypothetical protein [Jaaginema sp. PMC 1078.18]